MIYMGIFLTLLTLGATEIYTDVNLKRLFCVVIIGLILFSGLRYEVGIDYFTYSRTYEAIHNGKISLNSRVDEIESGFRLLYRMLPSYWCVLLFTSIFSVGVKAILIKKWYASSFSVFFSYFSLYFLQLDMGLVRQNIAMTISFVCVYFAYNKKLYHFLILIVIGFFFHRTIIIFLPAYWIVNNRLKKRMLYVVTLFSGFSFILPINDMLRFFLNLFPRIIADRYLIYLNNNIFEINDILRLFLGVFFIWMLYGTDEDTDLLVRLYIVGVCIYYVAMPIHYLSSRGSMYYTVFEIFLWAKLLSKYRKQIIIWIPIITYHLYYLLSLIRTYEGVYNFWNCSYTPYRMIDLFFG